MATDLTAPTAATYWRTLRHLRWSQLGYLALRRAVPRSHSPVTIDAPAGLHRIPRPWPFIAWQPEVSRQMIRAREFTFLNRTVQCNGSIPWNDRRHAKLWLYHLNYFDFLNVHFALPGEAPLLDAACEIALDWCRQNTKGTEVGWEPYPLSLRIVNWLKFLAAHASALESRDEGKSLHTVLASLAVQVATLEHRLEKDLRGNHLLKNLKALLFAGAMLESPRSTRWWSIGEELLLEQLHEQILPDGGHFERSPMYHAQVLEDLVEIRLLCVATGKQLACSELLSQKVLAMAQFLRSILHPDGEIPLFNDSTLDGACPPARLLAMTEPSDAKVIESKPLVTVFPKTGYGIIRSRESRSTLIFDCGSLGPDYQPGHGHCDVLSYELSLQSQRVVVDTGASTYEPGQERAYERSTAAHNTLRIDGEEQAEIWASFRVGRRPRVGEIRSGSIGAFAFVSGEHHAYRRLGVIHARTIVLNPPATWIVVDHLKGRGAHFVESFLHFHPRVRLEERADGMEASAGPCLRCWTLIFADQAYCLASYGAGQFELRKDWYSERFGDRQPSTTLHWAWRVDLPAGMIHVFTPVGSPLPQITADWSGNSIKVAGTEIPLR